MAVPANSGSYRAKIGVSLSKVTQESIKLTQKMIKELRRRSRKLDGLTIQELQNLTGMAAKMDRALAPLLKEARAIEDGHMSDAEEMTHEELADFIVGAFATLPAEHRATVTARLLA